MDAKVASSKIVKDMAATTGVSEDHVAKVLGELGLERFYNDAVQQNGGKEPDIKQTKLMFRLGKNSVVM